MRWNIGAPHLDKRSSWRSLTFADQIAFYFKLHHSRRHEKDENPSPGREHILRPDLGNLTARRCGLTQKIGVFCRDFGQRLSS